MWTSDYSKGSAHLVESVNSAPYPMHRMSGGCEGGAEPMARGTWRVQTAAGQAPRALGLVSSTLFPHLHGHHSALPRNVPPRI